MADDLVILAQFVKLGRLRKKVFMELAQKEISQICKLGEKKGKYCTSSTYHAVYDLIDKGLVEYVDPDSKRRKEVRLTDLGYNFFEKLYQKTKKPNYFWFNAFNKLTLNISF